MENESQSEEIGASKANQDTDPVQLEATAHRVIEITFRAILERREELLTLSEVEAITKSKRSALFRKRTQNKNHLPYIDRRSAYSSGREQAMNHRNESSMPDGGVYRVFVILAADRCTTLRDQEYNSVEVGQCEGPASASLLVEEALSKGSITEPKFVLLIPESHLQTTS
jgi:hypothetical protein